MPINVLRAKSDKWRTPIDTSEFAVLMDRDDPFASFRQLFAILMKKELPFFDSKLMSDDNEECLYFCGQSLGLKPKSVDSYVKKVLINWSERGVFSHFHGFMSTLVSDLQPKKIMAQIVGAKTHEVTVMNALSVNLHLLLATFYRPSQRRHKIIIEEHAFSSDMYVVKSQLRLHGYTPEDSLVLLKPQPGEHLLREEDILEVIKREGDQVMVALLPGIQYYTGQLLNIKWLTKEFQDKGIIVGLDLAHAVGNVPLYLHDWNIDFAVWCTYKYLCSGPGGVGGIFVHERYTQHGGTSLFPILQGWWGNNPKTKFLMNDKFDPAAGADMFKISTPSPIMNAMLMASLEIYSKTSIEKLKEKQFLLTGYLEFMIKSHFRRMNYGIKPISGNNSKDKKKAFVEIITPSDPEQRGAQLSLVFSVPLNSVHEKLQKRGVVCDIRLPNVMRVAPVPIYNSFTDVYKFIKILDDIMLVSDDVEFFDYINNCNDVGLIDGTLSN